jgi:hypothetical protein
MQGFTLSYSSKKKNIIHGLPFIEEKDGVCEGCALRKHH